MTWNIIKHQRCSSHRFWVPVVFFNFLQGFTIHHSLQAAIRKYSDGLEWLEDLDHATGTREMWQVATQRFEDALHSCVLKGLPIGLYASIRPKIALETIIRYDLHDLNKFTFVLYTPLCLHIKAAMCVWPCGRTVAKRVCSVACGSWANTRNAEQETSTR